MGILIGELGKNMQIFAITHLPQIASKGESHFQVYKTFNENREAKSEIKLLSCDERVVEIAKMLSGSTLTDVAIKNAKELLNK